MEAHLYEWGNLLLRWLHVIAGVAWIGASFYFNWLENNLEREGDKPRGVGGTLWAIHGGGFYYLQKYQVAPERLPERLHWFKWEAYYTWITGFLLLVVVYYLNASTTLIDPSVAPLSPLQASLIGIGVLIASWFVYDGLCRSPLAQRPALLAAVGFGLLVLLAFGLTHVFSGRGAYIHVGAAIGTIMAANVFRVIIPSQRALVRALEAGEAPDPQQGKNGFQRSRHNNYLTLPVLFIMISNHFPGTFGSHWNWAILAMLMAIGMLVRHYFNVRHLPGPNGWMLPTAGLATLVLIILTAPSTVYQRHQGDTRLAPVDFPEIRQIVENRCMACHAAEPTFAGFSNAPQGIRLDDDEAIRRYRAQIVRTAADTRSMPPGNLTDMTDAERLLLRQWLRAGTTDE
ncbi:hypothetical protein CAI21_21485 [Alkalilimnicola ehrlichii]|uniref:Cytochrome c domain-containing protein n=1 Tax=Alkalilimnicola ehrlichii TaxID=351052 RepID=A0A3E0WZH1_9GAMM|nr:urate hydroxylase PuuD [Alkalilimnicola ehrlichii]RFA24475.1 hypothetical protein CAI21_21485 [Alkalilimnicola ehrlichii]RFA38487.1 hypothetical protein CAL65_03790 [Alkalilimnicola ehrlichii]